MQFRNRYRVQEFRNFLQMSNSQYRLVCLLSLFLLGFLVLKISFDHGSYDDAAYEADAKFNLAPGNNETGYPYFVVPNIVHLIHLSQKDQMDISFVEVVTIRAAYFNQKPDRILFHVNMSGLSGPMWNMVKDIPVLQVIQVQAPTHVFGIKISSLHHVADIMRILILKTYGGIYIDSDTYIVRSLDKYRRYEMSVNWALDGALEVSVLIANPGAMFLKLWYEGYKDYKPGLWVYNSGIFPSERILKPHPELVHRVAHRSFNCRFHLGTLLMLYVKNDQDWKEHDTIHLLYSNNHHEFLKLTTKVPDLNADSIKTYNASFGAMARLVLYGKEEQVYENVPLRF